ncbi:MAG: type I polyketide synthase [Gemmatimonadota bacterium]
MNDRPAEGTRGDELKRAVKAVRGLRRRVEELEGRAVEPIAIVGMACRFPGGATDPEKLWDVLRDGVDATREVPAERWNLEQYYDPDPEAHGKVYARRGGFLADPVDTFDAAFFGISPREAEVMDPVQRLLLELSWESLENAGIAPHSLEGSNTGVFVGVSGSEFETVQNRSLPVDDVSAYRGLGSAACVAGGRISYVLGFHGPNTAVDTACSSSLVATALAVQNLRAGSCDLALAGGGQLMFSPTTAIFLCRMRALSQHGKCRTFDASADGYVRAEGGGMFVLKRLSDAEADGDRIHAVIRGAAFNHDGRSSGLTVPNPSAQRSVIEDAVQNAGLDPHEVDYVEAHGTATPLGDPIEVRAIAEALCDGRSADEPLLLGSIKTNFGHPEAAAGAAGLMKIVLSMTHEALPPHLHFEEPTPQVAWDSIPVEVVRELRPRVDADRPRRAGVSGFGFSGTNAHLIVESYSPEEQAGPTARGADIIPISGQTPDAVRDAAAAIRDQLSEAGPDEVIDVAHTLAKGRSPMAFRATAIGADRDALLAALGDLADGGAEPQAAGAASGGVAFLFTGQGAQYPGMARELYRGSAVFREAIDRCAEISEGHIRRSLLELLLEVEDSNILRGTEFAQPCLFAVEYALAELWKSWGVRPSYVTGHSLGEYVAATVAGVMSLEDALPLVILRGRLMQGLPEGGAMLAIDAGEADVLEAMQGLEGLSIAGVNGPTNTVVSGEVEAVEAVEASFAAKDVRCTRLEVSHAFHSHRMDPILDEFEQAVAAVTLRPPRLGIVSNLTGALMTAEDATSPARWRRHIREAVRFSPSLETLADAGVRVAVEIGPHPVLSGMGAAALPGAQIAWTPSLRRGTEEWPTLLRALGSLYRSGLDIDWASFADDRGGRIVSAPTYPFQRVRHWPANFGDRDRSGVALGSEAVHPLIGALVDSPAIDGWVFQQMLRADKPGFLQDHVVGGRVLVPGTAYIEMGLAAAKYGPGWDDAHLADLTFEQPLLLPDEGAARVQVVLSAVEGGQARMRVVVRRDEEGSGGSAWDTIATARVVRGGDAQQPAPSSPEEMRSEEPVDLDELHAALSTRGIDYGPAFRPIHGAWAGERLGFAELGLAASDVREAQEYRAHPALLDCGLRLLALTQATAGDERTTILPFGVEYVRFNEPFGAEGSVVIQARPEEEGVDVPAADLWFLSPDGRVVGEMRGFTGRRVRVKAAGRARDEQYTMSWVPGDAPTSSDAAGRWLVLDDGSGIAQDVSDSLTAAGGDVDVRAQGSLDDAVGEASSTKPYDGIVHVGARGEVGADAIADSVAVLTRLSASGRIPSEARLVLVTRGAAGPDSTGSMVGGALWGLTSVLQAEHPEWTTRIVDVDPYDHSVPSAELLTGASEEDRFVVRGDTVFVPRLRRGLGDAVNSRTPDLMRATNYRLEIERRGTLDAIHFQPMDRVAPEAGEVEVRVEMTGLNFRDVLNVLGQYPGDPGPPGLEFSGVVERVGEGVNSVAPGDLVVGMHSSMFTAYRTLPATAVVRRPGNVSAGDGATIPVAFLTAEWGLRHLAKLRAGERVLIHAGAGGVGQAAIQIARELGAEIYTTASEPKREYLRAQGVEHVFDSRSASFYQDILDATGGEGVDVVLNALTGELLQRSLDLLGKGGRFIELGKMELLDPDEVMKERGVEYAAFELGTIPLPTEDFHALFQDVVDRFADGTLRALDQRSFPAGETVEAFRFMAQARHIGKVTIRSARVLPEAAIRSDGAYVVTGASGGIGAELIEWLVDSGAGLVVATARSEPSGAFADRLSRLNQSGERVVYVRGDVASAEDAASACAAATRDGITLRGIFHAAGVLDDRAFEDIDRDSLMRVLAPKVDGARNLATASTGEPLDHFVLFSSIAGTLGGPGQASYAAANAALGAMAEERRRRGLPGMAIGWGAWGGAGMAARLDERQRAVMERSGMRLLDLEDGLEHLGVLLETGATTPLIASLDWAKLMPSGGARSVPLLSALEAGGGTDGAARPTFDASALDGLSGEDRAEKIREYVMAAVAAVLGLKPEQLALETGLGSLGFDSLMAVELRNRVEEDVGVMLPTGDLLGGGSVLEIAEAIGLRLDADAVTTDVEEPAGVVETYEF